MAMVKPSSLKSSIKSVARRARSARKNKPKFGKIESFREMKRR